MRPHAGFSYTKQMAAEVEFFGRDFQAATLRYEELLARECDGGGQFYGAVDYRSALGRIYMETDAAKARALLEEVSQAEAQVLKQAPESSGALYRSAAIEAILGRRTLAIEHLRRAFTAGWTDYRSIEADPRFDSLRNEESYSELLKAMKTRVASLRLAATAMLREPSQIRKEP